jgi:hypothetical protein
MRTRSSPRTCTPLASGAVSCGAVVAWVSAPLLINSFRSKCRIRSILPSRLTSSKEALSVAFCRVPTVTSPMRMEEMSRCSNSAGVR